MSVEIDNQIVTFKRIYSSVKDSDTGYQGHVYRNTSNGDLIVVHEGSIPLASNLFSSNFMEVYKDWFISNEDTLMGRINAQYSEAEAFLDYVKDTVSLAYPGSKIIQLGQSLGGTECELVGALDKNKNIETYTFNSFGAGHLIDDLEAMNKTISDDFSNIINFTYSNEIPTKINPHIGDVYFSSFHYNLQ